jgi:hypothetical protein
MLSRGSYSQTARISLGSLVADFCQPSSSGGFFWSIVTGKMRKPLAANDVRFQFCRLQGDFVDS